MNAIPAIRNITIVSDIIFSYWSQLLKLEETQVTRKITIPILLFKWELKPSSDISKNGVQKT
jgi:hypothetical protein